MELPLCEWGLEGLPVVRLTGTGVGKRLDYSGYCRGGWLCLGWRWEAAIVGCLTTVDAMEGLFNGSVGLKGSRVGEPIIWMCLGQGLVVVNAVCYGMGVGDSNDKSKGVFRVRGYLIW